VGVQWIVGENAFHEKADRSQVGSAVFFIGRGFLPPRRHCRHPSIRTLLMSDFRSVQVGRSRFSRCCHLIVDLVFHLENGSWARRLTQSPELGAWALSSFPGMF